MRPSTPPASRRTISRRDIETQKLNERLGPRAARQLHLWNELDSTGGIPGGSPGAPPSPSFRAQAADTSSPGTGKPIDRTPHAEIDLNATFDRVFRRLRVRADTPDFEASFQAFTGLRSTIRIKSSNAIEVRLSDLLEDARPLVLEALAEILITRLYRRRTSREARECYQAWAHSAEVVRRIEEVRRERGRKLLRPPRGRRFDLKEIFADLNRRFFSEEVQDLRIGWSPNRSRTMLGHYDSSHNTITITRWLDAPRVPRYVLEYLVFHEMLHARIPVEHRSHRRVVHSAEFVAAERAFPDYARATRWLRMGKRRRRGEAPWEGIPSG